MKVLLSVLTGTTAHVGISLHGVNKSGSRHLQRDGAFQRGSLDQFHLETDDNLGEVWKIHIWHDNTGFKAIHVSCFAADTHEKLVGLFIKTQFRNCGNS